MENFVTLFNTHWQTVEAETLSAVRRQLAAYRFDLEEVNDSFRKSCDEWFDGKLAPSIWYKNLSESQTKCAADFRDQVLAFRLESVKMDKPSTWWAYLFTALSLPATYESVLFLTEWGLLSRLFCTLGIGVLVWSACKVGIVSRKRKFEEQIVGLYKAQLDKQKENLLKILG